MAVYAEAGVNILTSASFYFLLACPVSKSIRKQKPHPVRPICFPGFGPISKIGNYSSYWDCATSTLYKFFFFNSCNIPEVKEILS